MTASRPVPRPASGNPAEQPQGATMTEQPPAFARRFRLHTPNGDTYDGVAFPSGRHLTDHPQRGLAFVAVSMEALLEEYPEGTRIERPEGEQ